MMNILQFKLRISQNNNLVEKIIKLREEIKLYLLGARAQNELPFQDGEEKTDDDDLFNEDDDDSGDDELDIVASNITESNKGGNN